MNADGLVITLRAGGPADMPRTIEIETASEKLFTDFGIIFAIADDHPFVVDERERWRAASLRGGLWFAFAGRLAIGFAALASRDGLAYLEQLAVRPDYGRRGVGRALVEKTCEISRARGASALWLTTYGHVPWNAPYYEKLGFFRVSERDCGPELQRTLAAQRAVLPFPEERVAMCRTL